MAPRKLTPDEKGLVLLRNELYDGSWQAMLEDLHSRLEGKPYVFKLARRIEEDIKLIEKLQKIEEDGSVNFTEMLGD